MKVTITVDDAGTDDAQVQLSTATDVRRPVGGQAISAGAAPVDPAALTSTASFAGGDTSAAVVPTTAGEPISAGPAPER
jgi:hypothetical protein